MTLPRISRALLLALLALMTACAVPLGPGFYIEKELLEVRFVPGAPPHLEIRATFTLRNTGNAPLDALDLSLPNEKNFGMQNLRITADGAAVSPQSPAADSPAAATARIPFPAPWAQKARHLVVVSYDLYASGFAASRFGLRADSFFLSTEGWFPHPLAPKGVFTEGGRFPKQFDLRVIVPPDFLVHAAGQPSGKKRRASETEFRFRLREGDFSPFVVAGRYHEQKFSDSNLSVLFWTLQPLPTDQAARSGTHFADSAKAFESAFGPRSKQHNPIWVAEAGSLRCSEQGIPIAPGAPTYAVPETVLLCTPTKLGRGSEAEEPIFADIAIAATWFEHIASPQSDLSPPLFSGLLEYARCIAENFRGNAAFRRGLISARIVGVDNGFNSSKAVLVLMALEDEVGREALQHALRRMIQSLRGSTYGWNDLRAALEAESGKNLGDFFRRWLNRPGIPADFRARYANQK